MDKNLPLVSLPFLDKQYTVFGKVIEGMEFVDRIKRGEPASEPDMIISFK